MKNFFFIISFISSFQVLACPQLQGKYKVVTCDGNEPTIDLHIPVLNMSLDRQHFEDELEIVQNGCEYSFILNGHDKGTLKPSAHAEWFKTYDQGKHKYQVNFEDKNELSLKARVDYTGWFSDRDRIDISFLKSKDGGLQVTRKRVDRWFLGVIPVIERWKAQCQLEAVKP